MKFMFKKAGASKSGGMLKRGQKGKGKEEEVEELPPALKGCDPKLIEMVNRNSVLCVCICLYLSDSLSSCHSDHILLFPPSLSLSLAYTL